MTAVSELYLPVAVMTLIGIGFPVGSFIANALLAPSKSGSDKTKLRSILLPGYGMKHIVYSVEEKNRKGTVKPPFSSERKAFPRIVLVCHFHNEYKMKVNKASKAENTDEN